jgi:hypothetical protein
MMTKKILITAALTAAMIGSALADDVDLIKGPMTYTNGLTGQVLAAKNNTAAILNVGIECAFLGKHDELLPVWGQCFGGSNPARPATIRSCLEEATPTGQIVVYPWRSSSSMIQRL